MSSLTNYKADSAKKDVSIFTDPDLLNGVLEEATSDHAPPTSVVPPALSIKVNAREPEPVRQAENAVIPQNTRRQRLVAYDPHPRTRIPSDEERFGWSTFLKDVGRFAFLAIGLWLIAHVLMPSWRSTINPFERAGATPTALQFDDRLATTILNGRRVTTIKIQDARVGDRIAGRNPIREQADLVEPDPATWRKLSLYMTKENGLGLWIELLRPLDWIEVHGASVGGTIELDLLEMGAVGEAKITGIGSCPPIKPGNGTVVLGTFKHQADKNSNVVNLKLEDQIELTGVTDNHPYWSVDRQEFVEVGQLRIGELVNTEFGDKRIISITPLEYHEFLYNLETTEHVYRVGSIGSLVHNTCAADHHFVMRALGSRTPYRHSSLTFLTKAEHTAVHQALNVHLKGQTKTVAGRIVDMMPRRGNSGAEIQKNFTKQERLKSLSEFYKTYDGGKYFKNFLNELKVATQNGWI